jgi:transcriptional regulator with XRE-family HTH domain
MKQKSNIFLSAKERILQYLDLKGYSQYDFSKKTGLSNGFLKSGNSVSSDNLKLLSNIYPDLNLMWVITGEGEMLREVSADEPLKEVVVEKGEEIERMRKKMQEEIERIKAEKDAEIKEITRELNREIGRLEERLRRALDGEKSTEHAIVNKRRKIESVAL